MSSKHTPGPWLAAGPTIWAPPNNAAPAGYALAHVLNPYSGAVGSADRVDANAALLAAAPELLEALKMALLWVDGDTKNIVRAAIAKAEGRE